MRYTTSPGLLFGSRHPWAPSWMEVAVAELASRPRPASPHRSGRSSFSTETLTGNVRASILGARDDTFDLARSVPFRADASNVTRVGGTDAQRIVITLGHIDTDLEPVERDHLGNVTAADDPLADLGQLTRHDAVERCAHLEQVRGSIGVDRFAPGFAIPDPATPCARKSASSSSFWEITCASNNSRARDEAVLGHLQARARDSCKAGHGFLVP